uniref:Uncharacterized protein n=1 Tax=Strigamia maritima TaxID=126957 RepID=T1JND8_STRMM
MGSVVASFNPFVDLLCASKMRLNTMALTHSRSCRMQVGNIREQMQTLTRSKPQREPHWATLEPLPARLQKCRYEKTITAALIYKPH